MLAQIPIDLPDHHELQDHYRSVLRRGAAAMLDALITA